MEAYHGTTADFVSHNIHRMNCNWHWKYTHSVPFSDLLQEKAIAETNLGDGVVSRRMYQAGVGWKRVSPEHVQRFSTNLLDYLVSLTAQGVTAWSEMFVPTVATWLPQFTIAEIQKAHIGEVYAWDGRVDEGAWARFVASVAMGPRLYHALKF